MKKNKKKTETQIVRTNSTEDPLGQEPFEDESDLDDEDEDFD